jgi:predicted transcriptional regulator of viral defense system
VERVRAALAQLQEPVFSVQQLRKLCAIRTETLCAALEELTQQGELSRNSKGYQLNLAFPVSRPIDPHGNGNGK